MNDIPHHAFRALRFTLKLGMIVYILLAAAAYTRLDSILAQYMLADAMKSYRRLPGLTAILALLPVFLIFANKIVDNAARIRAGLQDEPIPFSMNSILELRVLRHFSLVVFAIGFVVGVSIYTLEQILGLSSASVGILFTLFNIITGFLAPAMILSFLHHETASSIIAPNLVHDAIVEIGISRYITLIMIGGAVLGAIIALNHYVVAPKALEKIASDWFVQQRSGRDGLPFSFYVYHFAFNISFVTTGTFISNLFAFYFPRADEDSDESFQYGMDAAAREAITATLAGHGVSAPQSARADAEPLPDFSLLAAADTRNMGIETQKAFALALARADALLKSNKIDAGLALLAPFADETHDAAAYFPAYQRIYALKPQYELLQRLIAAAAHGHLPSYTLIRPELECIDPADLPADSVLPLAQFAARQQHYKTVLALTRQFAKNHPNHAQLIDIYILAARALAKSGAADKAQQLLQQLLARYPDHAKTAQIRHTLNLLQNQE